MACDSSAPVYVRRCSTLSTCRPAQQQKTSLSESPYRKVATPARWRAFSPVNFDDGYAQRHLAEDRRARRCTSRPHPVARAALARRGGRPRRMAPPPALALHAARGRRAVSQRSWYCAGRLAEAAIAVTGREQRRAVQHMFRLPDHSTFDPRPAPTAPTGPAPASTPAWQIARPPRERIGVESL
jgi:hypothetical protein